MRITINIKDIYMNLVKYRKILSFSFLETESVVLWLLHWIVSMIKIMI